MHCTTIEPTTDYSSTWSCHLDLMVAPAELPMVDSNRVKLQWKHATLSIFVFLQSNMFLLSWSAPRSTMAWWSYRSTRLTYVIRRWILRCGREVNTILFDSRYIKWLTWRVERQKWTSGQVELWVSLLASLLPALVFTTKSEGGFLDSTSHKFNLEWSGII